MESSAKTRLPLHSIVIIYSSSSLHIALHFGIISTLITHTIGGESKRALTTPFLAINAKGGERTAPPRQFQKFLKQVFNVFNWYISN
jgi:hypothetical protein